MAKQEIHQWSVHPQARSSHQGASLGQSLARRSGSKGALSERINWLPPPHSPSLGCEVHWLLRSWGKPGGSISRSLGACRRWSSQASPSPSISPILGYNSWGSVAPGPPFPAAEARQIPFSFCIHLLPQIAFHFMRGALYPQRRTAQVSKQMEKGRLTPLLPLAPATKGASGRVAPKGPVLPRAHEAPGSIRCCCPSGRDLQVSRTNTARPEDWSPHSRLSLFSFSPAPLRRLLPLHGSQGAGRGAGLNRPSAVLPLNGDLYAPRLRGPPQ